MSDFFFNHVVGKGILTMAQNTKAIKKKRWINLTTQKQNTEVLLDTIHHKQNQKTTYQPKNIHNIYHRKRVNYTNI